MANWLRACLLAALVLAPVACAHSVQSAGGRAFVVGLLNEPVTTNMKTGLDLCVQTADASHAAAPIDTAAFQVWLIAPSGVNMSMPLAAQYGRLGCYTFAKPVILTEAGQYSVEIHGAVNGSDVDLDDVKAGGAVSAAPALTFPDLNVPDNVQLRNQTRSLQDQVTQLREQLSQLDGRMAALQKAMASPTAPAKGSPAPAAAWAALVLVALAVAVRRNR